MKKTAVIGLLIIIAIISYVSYDKIKSNAIKNNNSNYEEKETITLTVNSTFDGLVDYSNAKELNKSSKYIAIVTIASIDKVINYDPIEKSYIMPVTLGKATIKTTIKGNINEEKISFVRAGGTLPLEDWLKADESPEKTLKLMKENGLEKIDRSKVMIKSQLGNDVDIEKGKTYLVYMDNSFLKNENEYLIYGLQYGLREIQSFPEKITSSNIKDLKVKNNDTGKFENLSDIINLN